MGEGWCHPYLANGLLREGMTAISLETLVLLRRKVVHENPINVMSVWNFGEGREKWKGKEKGDDALEVVFGLALPGELGGVVIIGHRRE
jgi:hypothetical protein